ncbi:hypothetical protein MASR1M12_03000 [Erysipelotrichia bacterium]
MTLGDSLDEMEDTVTNDLARHAQANANVADASHRTTTVSCWSP